MGSDSDSDADDGKVGDITAAPTSAASNPNPSKSELTNRLKSLYSSSSPPKAAGGANPPKPVSAQPPRNIPPTMNVARTGGPSSSHNPKNYVPPMVHQLHHSAPASSSQQHMQQQQPPPLVGVGRVPAPLPKARSNIRAAPPPSRMAAVPNPSIPPSPMTASSVSSRQSYSTQPRRGHTLSSGSGSSSQAVHHPQQMSSSEHSAHSSRSSAASLGLSEQEKKEKETFLMFTRVLMK